MAVGDKYEILEDGKGLFYIYVDRRGTKWKTRVRETTCLTCERKMHQIIRDGKGIQKYCCRKCRPVRSGFKKDKTRMDMGGLQLGRGWNKGLKGHLSEEIIKKMSLAHRGKYGELAPNWKGGFHSEDKRLRSRIEYSEWREAVFERDDYTCQHCGSKGVYLNAHHIVSFKYCPELRTETGNGIALCIDCHRAEHKRMRKAARIKNG